MVICATMSNIGGLLTSLLPRLEHDLVSWWLLSAFLQQFCIVTSIFYTSSTVQDTSVIMIRV